MSYVSIDTLQTMLKEQVFFHAQDSKKAAGRALGTLVEIITYYLLRTWGQTENISIERGLPEYGNADIKHNVEFLLHPLLNSKHFTMPLYSLPLSVGKLLKTTNKNFDGYKIAKSSLLNSNHILRNACLLAENENSIVLGNILSASENKYNVGFSQLNKSPYAMIECKRVGVEEGQKRGPQTIEKAKQGAYVAQNTSALQKIWDDQGRKTCLIYYQGQTIIKPYHELLDEIIDGKYSLKNFILSIGVVSNHGNWFTAENKNKELKVLAQAYDWLIFLTDDGLSQFVTDLLLNPKECYKPVQRAFAESYKEGKKTNIFTKSKINYDAHMALCRYFNENIDIIENRWLNVITPGDKHINELKRMLQSLQSKGRETFI